MCLNAGHEETTWWNIIRSKYFVVFYVLSIYYLYVEKKNTALVILKGAKYLGGMKVNLKRFQSQNVIIT